MNRSLRRRLFLILSASVLAAWLASAFFSYLDTRRQIDAMLDANLAHAADLLLALMTPVASGVHPAAEAPALSGPEEPMIAYRVIASDGTPLLVSAGMPLAEPEGWQPGLSDRMAGNERWRVHGAEGQGGLRVEVAQRHEVRTVFAAAVASHIMHPLWFAIPLLGLLIWLSVRWGLAPLQAITEDVARRPAADLAPLNCAGAPIEIRPLLEALNSLFARIGALLERERRFTADAAHELRTPLAAIRTHSEVARLTRETGERDRAIGHVIEGTDRATRLVQQLLVLARLDHQAAAVERNRVDLEEVLRTAFAEAGPRAASRCIDLAIEISAGEGPAAVRGSADLLRILVRNLLDNAVRYTPEGGKVYGALMCRDSRLVLEIRDTGPGIAAALRGRVLDRFFRLEGSGGEGSGLGLSIVARIVELHGASLEFGDDGEAGGLAVWVSFPLPED